jgi:hypothetical protein
MEIKDTGFNSLRQKIYLMIVRFLGVESIASYLLFCLLVICRVMINNVMVSIVCVMRCLISYFYSEHLVAYYPQPLTLYYPSIENKP